MNSLLVTLGISLSIIYCNAAVLDYSNITPWRIAYAVYPVYDSESWGDNWKNPRSPESWIEVWKNERSWNVFDNAINLRFNDDHKSDKNWNTIKAADLSDSHKNSMQLEKSGSHNAKTKQPSNYPWPGNDKDWPKNVKKDHAPIRVQ